MIITPKLVLTDYVAYTWLLNGKLHREDGPAVTLSDGTELWCLNGRYITYEEWEAKTRPFCMKSIININQDSPVKPSIYLLKPQDQQEKDAP
jgi:hypothetical protein